MRVGRTTAVERDWLRAHRKASYGTKIDVWSLGCLVFELSFGSGLFSTGSKEDKERAILAEAPVVMPRRTRSGEQLSAGALSFIRVRGGCE